MNMKFLRNRSVKLTAALVITALALWLSLRKINFRELQKAFSGADYILVCAAVLVSLLSVLVLSWRWRVLLAPCGRIKLGTLFRLNVISQAANILFPGRVGELAKSVFLSRRSPVSIPFALGTVIIEKALDFFVFLKS